MDIGTIGFNNCDCLWDSEKDAKDCCCNEIEIKYECCECGNVYDDEYDAEHCCGNIDECEYWICSNCGSEWEDEDYAKECCDEDPNDDDAEDPNGN